MSELDLMIEAAIAASSVICRVYERGAVPDYKPDRSPVTEADLAAEAVILERLAPSGLAVLAEESVAAGRIPELGDRYFVVDPLDGTKEFLKRNGEFTVNIALCAGRRPIAGVVLAPATGVIYWGGAAGAFRARVVDGTLAAEPERLRMSEGRPSRVVGSRSHGHAALDGLMERMGISANVSVGSSLKFCLVAGGEADLYPRFGPTCQWDTAAGQAVLEAAGGSVLTIDGTPLSYGHGLGDGFLNPYFVAATDLALAEEAAAEMRRALATHPG